MRTGSLLFLMVALAACLAGCNSSTYGSLPDYEQMSAAEIDNLIGTGLKAWRTPGAVATGASCANCHSPDALDLAYVQFNDFHVRRRGAEHVGKDMVELNASQLEDIVNMIHALRVRYSIVPKDPSEFRPFQPGGSLLWGKTAAEKELLFIEELQNHSLRFTEAPVLSREEALLQKKEWLSLNPAQNRIGIPLNRWSEDPYYQFDASPLADWLPILPILPRHGKENQWYSLHDQYLMHPSNDHLLTILQKLDELTYMPFNGTAAEIMRYKYKSVLITQHLFRKEVASTTSPKDFQKMLRTNPDPVFRSIENPFLAVTVLVHQLAEQRTFELPDELAHRYRLEHNNHKQLKELLHSWFWVSWLSDPSVVNHIPFLIYANENRSSTEPLPLFFEEYPIHYSYLITKSALEIAYGPISNSGPLHVLIPPALVIVPAENTLNSGQILFIENIWRMLLHLFMEQTDKNTDAYQPDALAQWTQIITEIETGFKNINSNYVDYNMQLIRQVNDRLNRPN